MSEVYLLTGAAGNLGTNVVRELLRRGKKIRALVLADDKAAQKLPAQVERVVGDVLDKESLARFFDVPDEEVYVIHMAGIVTIYNEFVQKIWDVNVEGTRNIVEQCVAHGVKKLVHVSSVHALPVLPEGQTMTEITEFDTDKIVGFYGKTKAAASQIVMDAVKSGALDASIIFPSGLCGPFDYARGHVTQLLIDCLRGKLPGGVKGGFDFVDVRDVAGGICACAERGGRGEGYILGNRYISVKEILHNVHILAGVREIKVMFPVWIAKAIVPFCKVYYKLKRRPPLFTKYSLYTLTANSKFSSEKARRELGFTTRPFRDTVADALKWIKSEGYA